MHQERSDIFISYSEEDQEARVKLWLLLRNNGFSVWDDKKIFFLNNSCSSAIQNAIAQSKVVVAICSTWALYSEEIEYAQEKCVPVIKVLTDNPKGLSSVGRSTAGTVLKMHNKRFEEKLISLILNCGAKPDTTKMYADALALRETAFNEHDRQKEKESFLKLMRAAELGDENAVYYIEKASWNIDLREAASSYKSINGYFVDDLSSSLYVRGEIIAEDGSLTDVPQRGRSMEQAAFRFMKRAIDLGYNGNNPLDHLGCFIGEKEIEECLNQLGASSRIHLNKESSNKTNLNVKLPLAEDVVLASNDISQDCPIFISYKRDNKDLVFPIKDAIEQNTGNKCWIDLEGIESDAQFANVIIKAINKAAVFLFMYSRLHMEIDDYDNDWTVREITFAQKKKKRIVFLNIDGSQLTDWFELIFGSKQQIDVSSEAAMKRLYRDIRKWLE